MCHGIVRTLVLHPDKSAHRSQICLGDLHNVGRSWESWSSINLFSSLPPSFYLCLQISVLISLFAFGHEHSNILSTVTPCYHLGSSYMTFYLRWQVFPAFYFLNLIAGNRIQDFLLLPIEMKVESHKWLSQHLFNGSRWYENVRWANLQNMTSSLLGHQYLLVKGRDKKCPSLFACLWAVHPCLSWKPVSRIGDGFGGHRTQEPHPSITSLCPPLCPALCPTHPRAQRTSYRGHEYNSGATTSI